MKTKEITPGKPGKQKPVSRFQQLWSEAESLAKENAELEEQLDVLVQRIDKEVLTEEREMGNTVRKMVYRQLEFANRKSLLKWQRAELNEWISENLSELTMLGLLDEPLRNAVAELRAFQLGVELDPDSELSAEEQVEQFLDKADADWCEEEGFSSVRNRPANLFDDDEDGMDEDYDEDDELEDEEALAELLRKLHEEFDGQLDPESQASGGKPINDEVFKRLFRQTAAALHPDREIDENRRQEKHVLMSQLLKARKERDLIAILKLHEVYASAESALSGDDEQALEDILVDYLNQQQARMNDIIQKSPMHHMAFSEFYSEKPATVNRRINAHLRKVRERRRSLNDFLSEIKTLKSLKSILEVRYESRMYGEEWF